MLKQTNEPKPSLRDKLVTRLERSLKGVQPPSPTTYADPMSMAAAMDSTGVDYSWQIFDQSSLQQMAYPSWPEPTPMLPKHEVVAGWSAGAGSHV